MGVKGVRLNGLNKRFSMSRESISMKRDSLKNKGWEMGVAPLRDRPGVVTTGGPYERKAGEGPQLPLRVLRKG